MAGPTRVTRRPERTTQAPAPLALRGILVAVDQVDEDMPALTWARTLTNTYGSSLSVLHVGFEASAFAGYGGTDYMEQAVLAQADSEFGESVLEEAVRALGLPPGSVAARYSAGPPGVIIAEEADAQNADLVILGTHPHSRLGRALLGTTIEGVKARAKASLLIARQAPAPAHILTAVDGTPASQRAARAALDLATRFDAKLTVLHVLDGPVLDLEEDPDILVLDNAGLGDVEVAVPVQTEIAFGPAAEAIVRTAASEDAALIVLGGRRIGGLRGLLTGSVASRVLAETEASVMVVRAPERP